MKNVFVPPLKLALTEFCRRDYARFLHALLTPRATQERLRQEILAAHATTELGKYLGIHRNLSAAAFRQQVPLMNFTDGILSAWIEKQREAPESSVLAPGGVRVFEKTSGSSGRHKLIPYNDALLGSFERYFRIWAHDLLKHGPRFKTLRTFISMSPSIRSPVADPTLAGFNDDTEYLSRSMRWFLRPFLTVPPSLKVVDDGALFRDITCAFLAGDPDLEIISVWHPTFFAVLWQHLVENRRKIALMLADKSRRPAGPLPPPNPKAAALLSGSGALNPADLWPKLRLLSAWDAGASRAPAERLRALFPYAQFQGKGLLATEAPMTLPLLGQGAVPFLTDVLFEFVDDAGRHHEVDDVTTGQTYKLVISQRGGLLRYQIDDQVCIQDKLASGTPKLVFVGRAGDCSDLVGEKLTAAYLAGHEDAFFDGFGPLVYCVLPLTPKMRRAHYTVLFDGANLADKDEAEHALAFWWEERLAASYHYRYARQLGQLGPVEARAVPDLSRRLHHFFAANRSMKSGDIKLKTLVSDPREAAAIWETLCV